MFRTIVLSLALAVGTLAAAEPEISFTVPAQLGQLKLEAGLYKIKVVGTMAMFTSNATGKSYSVLTRTEKTPQKSTFTAVMGASSDGVQRVETIVIAGSEYRLNFSK